MAIHADFDTSTATEIGCDLLAGASDIVRFDGATISFRNDADLVRLFAADGNRADALTGEAL